MIRSAKKLLIVFDFSLANHSHDSPNSPFPLPTFPTILIWCIVYGVMNCTICYSMCVYTRTIVKYICNCNSF